MLIILGYMAIAFVMSSVLLVGFRLFTNKPLDSPKKKHALESPTKGMSNPAKALYKEYMALPAESRPFPDIVSALRALDLRHSVDALAVQRHFDRNWLAATRVQNGSVSFTWDNPRYHCSHDPSWGCVGSDYYSLHVAIKEVSDSLAEKERAIALAASQPGVDMLKELESALRSEAGIQRQVVKELS